jgi:hypothetical protein
MDKGISNFKNVFDLYGQIGLTEVCFDVRTEGIYVYTTYDKSIHTMATFLAASFLKYTCDCDCIFLLNIKTMKENLKNITSADKIELTIENKCELWIKVTKSTIEFSKKVTMKETQKNILPTLDVAPSLSIRLLDFFEFCRSVNKKYNLTIKTSADSPEITFESEKSKVTIKSNNTGEDNICDFEEEFKAEYFSKLQKLSKFGTNLNIYAQPKQPLVFKTVASSKNLIHMVIWIKSLKQMERDYEDLAK